MLSIIIIFLLLNLCFSRIFSLNFTQKNIDDYENDNYIGLMEEEERLEKEIIEKEKKEKEKNRRIKKERLEKEKRENFTKN